MIDNTQEPYLYQITSKVLHQLQTISAILGESEKSNADSPLHSQEGRDIMFALLLDKLDRIEKAIEKGLQEIAKKI